MTAILFCDGSPNTEAKVLLDQLQMLDKRFVSLLIDGRGAASEAAAIADANIATASKFEKRMSRFPYEDAASYLVGGAPLNSTNG